MAGGELETLARELLAAADAAPLAAAIQEKLHARLAPGLLRHFQRKGLALSDAEELAQQTWILFWESLVARRYDPDRARLSTYLYALAHTIHLRSHRGKQATLGAPAESIADGARDPLELAVELDNLHHYLAGPEITPEERATLRAIAAGRTDRELAADQGISPSTAHQRKKTALARLRALLETPRVPAPPPERRPPAE